MADKERALTSEAFASILGILNSEDCQSWQLALNTLCSMPWQSFPCIMDWVLLTYRTQIRDCVCGMKASERTPLIEFLLSKNLLKVVRTTGRKGSGEWEMNISDTYILARFPFRKLSREEALAYRDVIRLVIRRIIGNTLLLPLYTAGFSVRSDGGPLLDGFDFNLVIDATCAQSQDRIDMVREIAQMGSDERK